MVRKTLYLDLGQVRTGALVRTSEGPGIRALRSQIQ